VSFWDATLYQVGLVLEAEKNRRDYDHKMMAWAGHLTAKLAMIGYHDPAKYPALDAVMPGEKREVKPMPANAIKAALRAHGLIKPKG